MCLYVHVGACFTGTIFFYYIYDAVLFVAEFLFVCSLFFGEQTGMIAFLLKLVVLGTIRTFWIIFIEKLIAKLKFRFLKTAIFIFTIHH